MSVTPPAPPAKSARGSFVTTVAKAVAFFQSAQGKRDVALVIAACGGAVEAFHAIFG